MIKKEDYEKITMRHVPSPDYFKNAAEAFVVGGGICAIGEAIAQLLSFVMEKDDSYTLTTVILIFLSATLTALGIYDKLARIGGAGTLVPVTGFANAVVSPALDTRSEGYILGVGSKIFTVAGPVILYSVVGGSLYGIAYFIISAFG
jgi:stage V sporulation protein AC